MKKEKLLSLQVLRALACLGIVLSHIGAVSRNFGRSGVVIFFMLSGFVLTYNYFDRDVACSIKENGAFAVNKIKKLYPLHIVTLVFMFVITIVQDGFRIVNPIRLAIQTVLHILLLQTWVPKSAYYSSMNGVAWFLSVMLFLYFCFPLLIKIIRKFGSRKTAIICMSVCIIIQMIFSLFMEANFINETYGWATYVWPIYRLGDFFEGCCLGYIFINRDKEKKINNVFISILEFITVGLVLFANNNTTIHFQVTIFLYYVCAILAVYLFALKQGIITTFMTNKIMIYFGDLSSNIFLIHSMILTYVNVFFYIINFEINPWANRIIVLVITFIASILWDKINKLIRIKKTSG